MAGGWFVVLLVVDGRKGGRLPELRECCAGEEEDVLILVVDCGWSEDEDGT